MFSSETSPRVENAFPMRGRFPSEIVLLVLSAKNRF